MWYPGPLEPKLVIVLVVAALVFGYLARQFVIAETKHVVKQQTCEVSDDCREAPEPAPGY